MAITQEQLLVSVEVQTRNAAASLSALNDKFDELQDELKSTDESVKRSEKSLDGFGASAVKMNQALELAAKGVRFLIQPIQDSIAAFAKASEATYGMQRAIKVFGSGDLDASVALFSDLRDRLADTTTVEDDFVESMVATGKQLGIQDDRLSKIIETAINLGTVMEGGVTRAFQGLLLTMKGNARAVGEFGLLLQGLTENELRAGKGIDILSERFSGFGENFAKTLPGIIQNTQKELGELFKAIGKILVEGFDLTESKANFLTFIKDIKTGLQSVTPQVVDTIRTVRAFGSAFVDALKAIDFSAILKTIPALTGALIALTVVVGALAATFATDAVLAFTDAILKQVAANFALAKSFLAAAAQTAVFVLGIAAIVSAVEILIRNVNNGKELLVTLFTAVLTGLGVVAEAVAKLTGADSLADWIQRQTDKIAAIGADASKDLDFGFTGQLVKQSEVFFGTLKKGFADVDKSGKDVKDNLADLANQGSKGLGAFRASAQEIKQTLDELNKKIHDLQQSELEVGASEADLLRIKAGQQAFELKQIEDKLRLQGALGEKQKELLALGMQSVTSTLGLKMDELRKKNLEEVTKNTKKLKLEVFAMDATTMDIIDAKRDADKEDVETKRAELAMEGKLNAQAIAGLDQQIKFIDEIAEKQKKKAPGREFEQTRKVGTDIADGISKAFTTGATGVVTGMLTGIGAIADVAQGLIDLVPGILDKVTNVVNSLTDLPNKILKGVQGLFGAVLKFIQDFIPNIIKMIDGLLESAVTFIEQLPEVFAQLLTQLPDMLLGLLNKLPEIAERLITALIELAPKLLISVIEFLVRDAPKIAIALIRVFAIELPKAIINAFIDALKEVGGMLSDLFKGKFPKIQVDTAQIAHGLKVASKALSGTAEKLFNVQDLTDTVKSADKSKEIADQIKSGVDKASAFLQKLWEGIIKAWRKLWDWINDHILQPFINLLVMVWQTIYDNILKPILDGLTAIWQFVYDSVVKPLIDGLREVWLTVFNDILKPFIGWISAVFQSLGAIIKGAWDIAMTVFNAAIDALKIIWDTVGQLFTNLWTALQTVWTTVLDIFEGKISLLDGVAKIFDTVFTLFTDDFSTLLKGAQNIFTTFTDALDASFKIAGSAFNNVSSILGDAGTNIWNGFKAAFDKGKSAITDVGGKLWDNFKTALDKGSSAFTDMGSKAWKSFTDAFNDAKTGGAKIAELGDKIWDNLKNGLANLGSIISDAIDKLNPANLAAKMLHFESGGVGTVERALNIDVPFANFAEGGIVGGQAAIAGDSLLNDKLLALVSPDEAIIPRSKMKNGAIRKIVEQILSGDLKLPKFGLGKFPDVKVPDIGGALGGVLGDLSVLDPTKLWDRVRDMVFANLEKMFQHRLVGGGLIGADSQYSRFQPGEFVMNKHAVEDYGAGNLHDINSGKTQAPAPQNITQTVNLTINTTQDLSDQTFVKNKIVPVVRQEFLRLSADNKVVVYAGGVRTI